VYTQYPQFSKFNRVTKKRRQLEEQYSKPVPINLDAYPLTEEASIDFGKHVIPLPGRENGEKEI